MNYYAKLAEERKNSEQRLKVPFHTYTGKQLWYESAIKEFIRETEKVIEDFKTKKEFGLQESTTIKRAEKNLQDAKKHLEYYSKQNSKGEKGYYAELIQKKNELPKVSMFILGTKSYNVASGSEYRLAAKTLIEEYNRKMKEAKSEEEKKKIEDWHQKKAKELLKASLKYK